MAENLTRQLLREHLTDGELTPGSAISLKVDQALLQDATGTMALMQFEQLDVARVKVDRAVQYVDHNVIQLDFKNPDDHRMLQALCRRHGIDYSRPGNGICHYVHIERYARPGGILLGADSHTPSVSMLHAEPNVRNELQSGAAEITARIEETGYELTLVHDFADRERAILIEGAVLRYLRTHASR